jgi:hypothetical protein
MATISGVPAESAANLADLSGDELRHRFTDRTFARPWPPCALAESPSPSG